MRSGFGFLGSGLPRSFLCSGFSLFCGLFSVFLFLFLFCFAFCFCFSAVLCCCGWSGLFVLGFAVVVVGCFLLGGFLCCCWLVLCCWVSRWLPHVSDPFLGELRSREKQHAPERTHGVGGLCRVATLNRHGDKGVGGVAAGDVKIRGGDSLEVEAVPLHY